MNKTQRENLLHTTKQVIKDFSCCCQRCALLARLVSLPRQGAEVHQYMFCDFLVWRLFCILIWNANSSELILVLITDRTERPRLSQQASHYPPTRISK